MYANGKKLFYTLFRKEELLKLLSQTINDMSGPRFALFICNLTFLFWNDLTAQFVNKGKMQRK